MKHVIFLLLFILGFPFLVYGSGHGKFTFLGSVSCEEKVLMTIGIMRTETVRGLGIMLIENGYVSNGTFLRMDISALLRKMDEVRVSSKKGINKEIIHESWNKKVKVRYSPGYLWVRTFGGERVVTCRVFSMEKIIEFNRLLRMGL